MKKFFLIALFSIFLCPFSLYALESMNSINVYIYPHELTAEDKLVDGPNGTPFKITDNTLLIWVDLHPDMKFTHPTAYILISSEGTQVEDGGLFSMLNASFTAV